MSELAVRRDGGDVIEAVITKGDLAKLSPAEKTRYYAEVCRSVGLNPFTRPFEYISLSGKLTLYARREATDQLRKLNGISLEVISRDVAGDILTVHVRAKDKSGRTDEDYGAVSIKGLAGDALSNQMMKAVTKAKRRVTLSISGLGFLDESELESIPAHDRAAPADTVAQLDAFAGDAVDAAALEDDGRAAAAGGRDGLRAWFRSLTPVQRDAVGPAIGDPEHPGALLRLAAQADNPAGIPPAAAPHVADAAAPAGEAHEARVRSHDPDTGELFDGKDTDPLWLAEMAALRPKEDSEGGTDWRTYAEAVCYMIGKAGKHDLAAIEISKNVHLRRLREEDIDRFRSVTQAINARARELAGGAAAA